MSICSRSRWVLAPCVLAFAVAGSLLWIIPRIILAQENAAATSLPAQGSEPEHKLLRSPIFLEVSDNLLENFPIPSPRTRWSFPEEQADSAELLFLKSGLPPGDVEAMTEPRAVVRSDGWVHYFPSNSLIEEMSREARATLYPELARYPINEFHESPVLILTDTVEEWYKTSHLLRETVSDISRMAYRRGSVWAFSDVPLLVAKSQGESDLKTLFKALTRTRTYLVRLPIGPKIDTVAFKAYWRPPGSTFRRKDIEPLIESLKETGMEMQLDLVHLMPPLARKLLYTYPGPENTAKGILPDCHWTCLNYFNYEPHGYLLDSKLATSKVLEDYELGTGPYHYGDILFFIDDLNGDAFHSCVFLKEDLVFTKNGRNQMAPWIISTLDEISRIYLTSRKGHIEIYRLRGTKTP